MTRANVPLFVALLSAATLAPGVACSSFDQNAITEVTAPDYGQFTASGTVDGAPVVGVEAVLEKRCGTLDCHGQMGRALRIFGIYGLRLFQGDASNTPGMQPTTQTELVANYQSVIGLQPELMTEVVQGNAPPTALLLLRKPLQLERHKGGAVFNAGDPTYNCIVSWLGTGQGSQTVYQACALATGLAH
jgi:hypothetical protein